MAEVQVEREVEVDAPAEEVWRFLSDPDELAAWLGQEVLGAPPVPDGEGDRRLRWTWAPDGHESTVELTVTEVGDRTRVHVIERAAAPTSSARACALGRWDDALLDLELRALVWTRRLVHR